MRRHRRGLLPTFQTAAPAALADTQLRDNLQKATRAIREKRAGVVGEVRDWEDLTMAARDIKERTMGGLDRYLVQLERSVEAAGGRVHWARDGAEASRLIAHLVEETGATSVVMLAGKIGTPGTCSGLGPAPSKEGPVWFAASIAATLATPVATAVSACRRSCTDSWTTGLRVMSSTWKRGA